MSVVGEVSSAVGRVRLLKAELDDRKQRFGGGGIPQIGRGGAPGSQPPLDTNTLSVDAETDNQLKFEVLPVLADIERRLNKTLACEREKERVLPVSLKCTGCGQTKFVDPRDGASRCVTCQPLGAAA